MNEIIDLFRQKYTDLQWYRLVSPAVHINLAGEVDSRGCSEVCEEGLILEGVLSPQHLYHMHLHFPVYLQREKCMHKTCTRV